MVFPETSRFSKVRLSISSIDWMLRKKVFSERSSNANAYKLSNPSSQPLAPALQTLYVQQQPGLPGDISINQPLRTCSLQSSNDCERSRTKSVKLWCKKTKR